MGQNHGRPSCISTAGMASPVFRVDSVRGAKGGFSTTSRYHVNRKLREDYKVEQRVLGRGASGPVHLATRGKRQYAVKSFTKRGLRPEKKSELRGEVEVYLKLDHPHVARLENVYETDRELHLVMELMSGGELYARLAKRRNYSEVETAQTCRQMLFAVAYLHANNIVHRDLKLENFLYEQQDTDHLKLIDFGFAKFHTREQGKMSRSCGSLHYIAPEVLNRSYDNKADMWSLGVIVYMLLTGNPPFYGSTDEKCLYRIRRGEPSYSTKWFKLSSGAQTFVKSLLSLDPEARPSAKDALSHAWLSCGESPKTIMNDSVLASLRSFAHASHFRRACLSMMAWSLTLEDQAELRLQFQNLDTNKTGTISQQDLATALKENFSIDSEEIDRLFAGLDVSGDHEIRYAQFLAAVMQKRMRMREDVLHQTFQRFDRDGTGEITANNLQALLGPSFEGSDIQELIREADLDGDGRLSYEDFRKYLHDGDWDDNQTQKTEEWGNCDYRDAENLAITPRMGPKDLESVIPALQDLEPSLRHLSPDEWSKLRRSSGAGGGSRTSASRSTTATSMRNYDTSGGISFGLPADHGAHDSRNRHRQCFLRTPQPEESSFRSPRWMQCGVGIWRKRNPDSS